MAKIITVITYRGDAEFMAKEIGPILNRCLVKVVEFRQAQYMPRHFESFAAAKYGYQRRTVRYVAAKQKKGIAGSLQWSGDLKQQLLRRQEIRVGRSKSKPEASAVLRGPRYFYMAPTAGPKGGMHPDMRNEVRTDAPDELKKMAQMLDFLSTDELNNIRDRNSMNAMHTFSPT